MEFTEVVLTFAKSLPTVVPVRPVVLSSALRHCVDGADKEDGGAVMW